MNTVTKYMDSKKLGKGLSNDVPNITMSTFIYTRDNLFGVCHVIEGEKDGLDILWSMVWQPKALKLSKER